MIYSFIEVAESYTIQPTEHLHESYKFLVIYKGFAGNTITMPPAEVMGREIVITNAGPSTLTVQCQGPDTISGSRTAHIASRQSLSMVCTGVQTWVYTAKSGVEAP